MHRKGIIDGNYDPKLSAIKRLPQKVRLDPTSTVKILKPKVKDVCSKGAFECRGSNNHVVGQLKRLSALSPSLDV